MVNTTSHAAVRLLLQNRFYEVTNLKLPSGQAGTCFVSEWPHGPHALLEQARALGLLGSVEIVDSRWLLDSLSRWARQPEAPYRLPLEAVQAPDDDGE